MDRRALLPTILLAAGITLAASSAPAVAAGHGSAVRPGPAAGRAEIRLVHHGVAGATSTTPAPILRTGGGGMPAPRVPAPPPIR